MSCTTRGWKLLCAGLALPLLGANCPQRQTDQEPTDVTDSGGSGGSVDAGGSGGTGDIGRSGGGSQAAFIEVPDPLSGDNPRYPLAEAAVPAAGGSVRDDRLATTQTRVTAAEGLRHEYARFDPFNCDGTMILLHQPAAGAWRVYRTQSLPYDQEANLVRGVDLAEMRWDPADPRRLWGLRDFQIRTLDVQTGSESVVKDFSQDVAIGPILTANPDLYRITTREEGESSLDKRYWAFMLQGTGQDYRPRYLFTWDRQQDRVPGVYPLSADESRIDWVGVSPLGNWVLLGADWDNGGNLYGMVIADRELTRFQQIDYNAGHSDVGLDAAGREVIVLQSNRTDHVEMLPLSWETRPIDTGGSYEGTGRVRLIRLFYQSGSPLALNSGIHVSCNAPGWCVISTFTEPGLAEQNWLDRTIALVRLDAQRPRVYDLATVYGTSGAYWEETQAAMSADGSKVVWASNWGRNVGQERVWLMQLNMPAGWMQSLAAP